MAYTDLRQQQDALSALVAAPSSQQRTIEENKLATQKALSDQALEPARLKEQERIYAGREQADSLKQIVEGTQSGGTSQKYPLESPEGHPLASHANEAFSLLGELQKEYKQLEMEQKQADSLSIGDDKKAQMDIRLATRREKILRLEEKAEEKSKKLMQPKLAKITAVLSEMDRNQDGTPQAKASINEAYQWARNDEKRLLNDMYDEKVRAGELPDNPKYREDFVNNMLKNSGFGPEIPNRAILESTRDSMLSIKEQQDAQRIEREFRATMARIKHENNMADKNLRASERAGEAEDLKSLRLSETSLNDAEPEIMNQLKAAQKQLENFQTKPDEKQRTWRSLWSETDNPAWDKWNELQTEVSNLQKKLQYIQEVRKVNQKKIAKLSKTEYVEPPVDKTPPPRGSKDTERLPDEFQGHKRPAGWSDAEWQEYIDAASKGN